MASYKVQAGDSLSRIAKAHNISLNRLLSLNPKFKANPNDINVGDTLVVTPPTIERVARARASEPPRRTAPVAPRPRGAFKIPRGQITFDVEGMEGGRFHSRTLHVPGERSGATIGRGYDMSERSKDEIAHDLGAAGIAAADAQKLATLRGFRGKAAEQEISRRGLSEFEITPEQQKRLFLTTYDELAGDVKRICLKADVVAKYGATDWQALDPILEDVLVDLRYRGDYTPMTREKVQPCVVSNDRAKLAQLMANESYWVRSRGVPMDRFRRRTNYIASSGSG